jgi:cytochrome P450
VSKAFTPRAVSRWEERSRAIVDGLLDVAAERGRIDAIADFALIVPARIISEMLGMPAADGPQLQAWSSALSKRLDPVPDPQEEAAAETANEEMTTYVEGVIADRRKRPTPDEPADLLDAFLMAEDQGDVLDDGEIIAQVFLLYIAGHETTRNLIGNGLAHLFAAPDQLDRLRADPELDANTVEEVLRIESPAQLTRRVTHAPCQVGDVTIPPESHITLLLASANRDPRRWGPTADRLDIGRVGANEHVSFGGGSHFCLGNSLARLESRVALPAIVRRFPRMEPAYDRPEWSPRVVLRGIDRLPVTLT